MAAILLEDSRMFLKRLPAPSFMNPKSFCACWLVDCRAADTPLLPSVSPLVGVSIWKETSLDTVMRGSDWRGGGERERGRERERERGREGERERGREGERERGREGERERGREGERERGREGERERERGKGSKGGEKEEREAKKERGRGRGRKVKAGLSN